VIESEVMFVDTFTRKNLFLDRSRLFGSWTSLGHQSITEIFTFARFDFVGIDLEHSTITQDQAQIIIASAHAGGAACLPRVSSHNGEQIKRLLDSGGDGIIVPNVSTREEVERIVGWCKYPPLGKRSYGVASAQGYGFDFDEYTETWNDRSTVIIQIESIRGVDTVDDLLDNEAVDGAMVGPYDLSGTLGIPGQLSHRKVTEACEHVVDACRRRNKACGTHLVEPSEESVKQAFDSGYSFLVMASDVFVLWKWSDQMRTLMKVVREKDKV